MNQLLRAFRPLGLAVLSLTVAAFAWAPASAQSLNVTALPGGGVPYQHPLDATPDPDGQAVYFVATTESGEPAVFRVPAAGGEVEVVYAGAPLVSARSLVISGDGNTLYIADPMAGGGLVFALQLQGGLAAPAPLVASVRTGARALDLVSVDGADRLYIGGTDPRSGEAAVYRLALAQGTIETLHTGTPLAVVDGLAAAHSGAVYIATVASDIDAAGRVLRLRDGTIESVIEPVQLGRPAGVALSLDEGTLFVSSLAEDGTAQVVIADLATGATSPFSEVIGANQDSGGLHRAHNRDLFAWADAGRGRSASGNAGNVYAIARAVTDPESEQ